MKQDNWLFLVASMLIMSLGSFTEYIIYRYYTWGSPLGHRILTQFIIDLLHNQNNAQLLIAGSNIFRVMCVIGVAGLVKNHRWGINLSVINCVVMIAVFPFVLRTCVWYAVAGSALIMILIGFCKNKKSQESSRQRTVE